MTREQEKKSFRNAQEWFAVLDKYAAEEPFVFDREQPVIPERVIFDCEYSKAEPDE